MILVYIFIGLFIAGLIFSGVLMRKLYKSKVRSKELEIRVNELEESLKGEIVKLSHREGFYDSSYNIGEHKYEFRVYVTELEKYNNGFSKLKLESVNIKSGFDMNNYSVVKSYAKEDFLEIQETKNITFLEKDVDISEIRKNKLERILKGE